MKKAIIPILLLLALLCTLTACGQQPQQAEKKMLYDEAPSRYEYGVFVNMDVNAGDAITDYAVAFNNFANRTAYALYSELGQTPVTERIQALGEDALKALVGENKAIEIQSNDGFHDLPASLLSLDGHAYSGAEKDVFYYVYVAYTYPEGISVEKAPRMITPKDGPAALTQYSANSIGAIVPAGGATSIFAESSSYSPGYVDALKQGAVEAGVSMPRVAVIETTMGSEQAMYDDMFLPDGDYASFGDTFRARGMEPVYIPLAIDNYTQVQNTKYFADLIRSCHIVFFTGGDQAYYGLALANSDGSNSLVADAILDVLRAGGTLGGSSAGAAAMSGTVLTNGASGSYFPFYWNGAEKVDITSYTAENIADNATKQEGNNMIYDSIGFVEPILGKDVLLDTHVDARGRVGRLIAGLRDTNPTGLGIAMDETSGIRIDGATKVGTVFGTSGVYIVDASGAKWNPAGTVGEFGVTGLKMHYLTAGDQYDFAADKVIPAADKSPITNPTGEAYASKDVFGTDETGTTVLSLAHSADSSVTAEVAKVSLMPYLTANSFTVTFEKGADTVCYTNGQPFPDEDYFHDFLQTTVANLIVDIAYGPSRFDPSEASGFAALSAETESNEYAVDIKFSAPISVGYEGNNKYFLDCEEAENIPTDYVEVYDAEGNVKEQDRTYTFKILNDDTLRIVLVDDVYFAEGDTIITKTTITSLYGENAEENMIFTLHDGVWTAESGGAALFLPQSAKTEGNEYAVEITFSEALSVGYEGNNNYFLDCEEAANIPTDYVEVYDADGNVKAQDRTYTFKLPQPNVLRIVLVDDVYFAEGDVIVVKTTITNQNGGNVAADTTFTLTDGQWLKEGQEAQPIAEPTPAEHFVAESAVTEENEYAVMVTFSDLLSVGYEGSNKYFLDCEEDANVPTQYVEVFDADGNVKEQDRTYTFKLPEDNVLRIVLVDDVYFAEGDTIVLHDTITSLFGVNLEKEVAFQLNDGAWVKMGAEHFVAESAVTEDNEYAVEITFSDDLSVGYEGNNKYFLDCEEDANVPTQYVEVFDASGAVKEQDRTYTFKLPEDNVLRIVLVDDVYFADGDVITVHTTVTSLSGAALEEEATFKLENGTWVKQ